MKKLFVIVAAALMVVATGCEKESTTEETFTVAMSRVNLNGRTDIDPFVGELAPDERNSDPNCSPYYDHIVDYVGNDTGVFIDFVGLIFSPDDEFMGLKYVFVNSTDEDFVYHPASISNVPSESILRSSTVLTANTSHYFITNDIDPSISNRRSITPQHQYDHTPIVYCEDVVQTVDWRTEFDIDAPSYRFELEGSGNDSRPPVSFTFVNVLVRQFNIEGPLNEVRAVSLGLENGTAGLGFNIGGIIAVYRVTADNDQNPTTLFFELLEGEVDGLRLNGTVPYDNQNGIGDILTLTNPDTGVSKNFFVVNK